MCSHDDCEDVYHLRCTGLKALPEGDWYCPPPGCLHSRGAVIPQDVAGAAPCAHRWEALPPLRVGARRYRRVLCDGARVYYALTPLARDVTGLAGRVLADAVRTAVGDPDRVYVRESVFPHDVTRLRALRLMNAATHSRALVTADGLCRAFRDCPVPRVQQRLAELRAALDADVPTPVPAVGMKRAREEEGETESGKEPGTSSSSNSSGNGDGDEQEEDDEAEEGDLDEEMACAPHPVLEDIVQLQEQLAQFRAVVAALESEVTALKKAVSERMAAAEASEAGGAPDDAAAAAAAAQAQAPLSTLVAPPPPPQQQQVQEQPPVLPAALPLGISAPPTQQLQLQQQPVRWQ